MEERSEAQSYRFALIKAIISLKRQYSEISIRIVNIAMNGEYSDINAMMEIGDEIPSDLDYFKNCKDGNVQCLLKQIEQLEVTYSFLMNVNNISEEELDIVFED